MGHKTKIDWCDSTWNPVTGCLHGCEYCYARRIAERFGGCDSVIEAPGSSSGIHILDQSAKVHGIAPYPFFFEPTLHRYQLEKPQHWKKTRNIFVCSMADLFGDWVPGEWIREVMDACYAAHEHRYLFLTKNPKRYDEVTEYLSTDVKVIDGFPQMWFGATASSNEQLERAYDSLATWISIEPILERIETDMHFGDSQNYGFGELERGRWKWIVIGAETGNRIGKVIPKKDWIMEIVKECEYWKTPIFMKESLRGLMGSDFRQEFPWG